MSLLLALVGGGGPAPITGNMTTTLAAVTLTTSASLPVAASLTATLAAITLTSDADISVVGSMSTTLDDVTLTADGTLVAEIVGTLTTTLADVTLTTDADLPLVGSLSSTLADAALTADADLPLVASLSATLSDVTLSGSAAASISASLASSALDGVTLDGSGILVLSSTKVRAHLLSPLWNVAWVDSRALLHTYSTGFLKQILDVLNGTLQSDGNYAIDLGYLRITIGTGAPNGVVTGSPPDIYLNKAGGASTTIYVKESGTATNTGWVGV